MNEDIVHTVAGMELSGWCSDICIAEGSRTSEDIVQRNPAPNLCRLPWCAGQRPAVERASPRDLWVSGESHAYAFGNIPAWETWRRLACDTPRPILNFVDIFQQKQHVELSEIISAIARHSASTSAHGLSMHVVAMPDHFTERQQTNLLAGLRDIQGSVRLLWNSVAVILACSSELQVPTIRRLHGKHVCVVNVGNDEITATVLSLKAKQESDRWFLVPVRELPENQLFQRWHVRPLDLALAASILQENDIAATPETVWRLFACTDITHRYASRDMQETAVILEADNRWHEINVSPQDVHNLLPDMLDNRCEAVDGIMKNMQMNSDIATHNEVMTTFLPKWLQGIKNNGAEIDEIFLAGPVSELPLDDEDALGRHFAEVIDDVFGLPAVFPGAGLPDRGSISIGCALYGLRELFDLPTYYERLPQFSIVGKDERNRREEITKPLVEAKGLAKGGKQYENHLVNIAAIRNNQRKVRFRLRRQEVEKQLIQEFPAAPQQDCRLSFDVTMRPAQGFARVVVVPEDRSLFGNRQVVLDWDKMEDYKEPNRPNGLGWPECAPLPISAYSTVREQAIRSIKEYLNTIQHQRWGDADEMVRIVGQMLQNGRVLGSEPSHWIAESLLHALQKHHTYYENMGIYERHPRDWYAKKKLKNLMRAATALYSSTPAWAKEFLEKEFKDNINTLKANPDRVFTYCAGRCFTSEAQIQLFVECMIKRFRVCWRDYHDERKKRRWNIESLKMEVWCKSLQLILRLDEQAPKYISSDTANRLARIIYYVLESEVKRQEKKRRFVRGVSRPYQNAMLSLFYLLRYREIDECFLTKQSFFAQRIRKNLEATNNKLRAWRSRGINGTVQESLLHFLDHQATDIDVTILSDAEEELADNND